MTTSTASQPATSQVHQHAPRPTRVLQWNGAAVATLFVALSLLLAVVLALAVAKAADGAAGQVIAPAHTRIPSPQPAWDRPLVG